MRIKLGTGAVLCLLLIQSAAVNAATLRQKLENFDFFGTWAAACDRPPSGANTVRKVFLASDGRVEFTESFGKGYEPNMYEVFDAAVPDQNTIVLNIELNGLTRQKLTMARRNGELRTMSNQAVDSGSYIVKDGLVTGTGLPTPSLSHCPDVKLGSQ
jgi:hypothetical protein